MLDVSAHRLEKFSYKALDISALRAKGSEALGRTLCDFNELITQAMEEVQSQALSKNITIDCSLHAETIPMKADRVKMKNVLAFILDNAIRFSDRGATVEITTRLNEDLFTCSIADRGCGFSDYALQNLFRPFSNTRHHVDSNAGLSLYYSRLTIDAHGGSISVSHNGPSGSVVTMVLPVKA